MLFVVGNSRSGTTMLGRMLGNHEQINTFGELHFFEQMVDATAVREGVEWSRDDLLTMLERLLTSSREVLFAPVRSRFYRDDAERILEEAGSRNPVTVYKTFLLSETKTAGCSIPCEQTPRYLYQVEEILQAIPEAKIICLVRDPRAVLLSQKNKWKRRKLGASSMPLFWALRAWVNYHPYTMSRMWVSASRRAIRLQGNPRVLVIRFEDLVIAPGNFLQDICKLCDIEYTPAMLDVAQIGSSSGQDQPNKIGIDPNRANSWNEGGLTPGELALCQRVASEQMAIWGYAPHSETVAAWHLLPYYLSFVFKSAFALLLNFNRVRSIREVIARRFA